MEWAIATLAVVILGLAAVAATGRLGELPSTVTDMPQPHVPDGVLDGADLRGLRFAVVARGYSMQQVDELLDRLAAQLDGIVPEPGPVTPTEPVPQGYASPSPLTRVEESVATPEPATTVSVPEETLKPLSPPEPVTETPLKPLSPPEPVTDAPVEDLSDASAAALPAESELVTGSVVASPNDPAMTTPEAIVESSEEVAAAEPIDQAKVQADSQVLDSPAASIDEGSVDPVAEGAGEADVLATVAETGEDGEQRDDDDAADLAERTGEEGAPAVDLAWTLPAAGAAPGSGDSSEGGWGTAEESLRHLEELIARLSGKAPDASYDAAVGPDSDRAPSAPDGQPQSPGSAPQQG